MRLRKLSTAIALLSVCLSAQAATSALADNQTNRIRVEYAPPANPAHQSIHDTLKDRKALETLQQVFSPFKLPVDLTLRTVGCRGISNAWYQRPIVSVCYEYLDEILQNLPATTTPAGITSADAMLGQFFYVFAHEIGHAIFDLLDIPLFGGLEDSADQFATYIMLQFGSDHARSLIGGAAYSYQSAIRNPSAPSLAAFSDIHSPPAQRFYNLLCIAYGSDTALFADLVQKGYLPEKRATDCKREYGEVAYAFYKLIVPHLDAPAAKQMLRSWPLGDKPRAVSDSGVPR